MEETMKRRRLRSMVLGDNNPNLTPNPNLGWLSPSTIDAKVAYL